MNKVARNHFVAFRSETMNFAIFINPLMPEEFQKVTKKIMFFFELQIAVTSARIELESCFKNQNVGNFLLSKEGMYYQCFTLNPFRVMTS